MTTALDIDVRSSAVLLKLKGLSANAGKEVAYATAVYLKGNKARGLMHYQKYKHITRKAAYGQTFKSHKQRRYVMMMIKRGEITPGFPKRTGRAQRAWTVTPVHNGARIRNDVPYAPYLFGESSQSRLNALAGWRKVSAIILSNRSGMLQAGEQALKRLIS